MRKATKKTKQQQQQQQQQQKTKTKQNKTKKKERKLFQLSFKRFQHRKVRPNVRRTQWTRTMAIRP